jgi:endoglucanase
MTAVFLRTLRSTLVCRWDSLSWKKGGLRSTHGSTILPSVVTARDREITKEISSFSVREFNMKKNIILLLSFLACNTLVAAERIAVDQAGYTSISRKIAIFSSYADSFQVLNAETRIPVYRGAVGIASLIDAATGLELYSADFTSLASSGLYFVRTSAGDSSVKFLIADTVYHSLFRATVKSYYFQRCGLALTPALSGSWSHPACHVSTDGMFHSTAESTGTAVVTGGWHDAGDYGKYVVNAGVTVGTMLMAYDYFPGRFGADDLQIPESNNGVPDILDEVRFELDWLLKMQASSGGVFFKVTKPSFEAFVMPNNDGGQRYIYRISSTATADFAAMMSRASQSFKPFDTAYAARCLSAAVRAWGYLLSHPAIVPTGGFKNPSGTSTGEYGDTDDSDERLWAAAEIYLANGDSTAHKYFLENYASRGIVNSGIGWGSLRSLAEIAYLKGATPGSNATVRQNIKQSLMSYCQGIITLRDGSGFRSAIATNNYWWGSNSTVLNNGVLLLLGREQGGPEEWEAAALDQLHYILGVNAHVLSFVTGTGARSVMHPHHRPSESDGVVAPVPGLVVGGPNHSVGDDAVLSSRFTSSTPAALCYVDTMPSYASNETCINWNAPLVFLAGYFARSSSHASVIPPPATRPEGIKIGQNYPNPFNGTTVITFSLSRQMDVVLRVVDVLGRDVDSIRLGLLSPGFHQTVWDSGKVRLSSGSYFYSLMSSGGQVSEVRSLRLLR